MFVFTDGSCSQNPGGVGGWSLVMVLNDEEILRKSGYEDITTSNRMELMAILEALRLSKTFEVFSDSQYAVKVITGEWGAKANQDLVFEARNLLNKRRISWIKGHNGNKWNHLADELANQEMLQRYRTIHGKEFIKPSWWK